jgi:L-ascorbate metabolism protein UlaG (beta-lactamase superfamily)
VSKLHWFGTSAILYNGSQVIYFDPITLSGELPPADIILVTHAHTDHWSVKDIQQIIGPNTTLVISPNVSGVYESAREELGIPATILAEGETTEVNGVSIAAVPAFDTHGHLRENGGAGYIVAVDDLRIYHAGATLSYPEMAQYECDIAILPLYTADEARTMIKLIPAETFVIGHTSYYTVQALAKLAAEELEGRQVADLKLGPFEP